MKNSILLSGSALVLISTIAKLMGFVREQAFASALGAGQLADAYVLATFIAGFSYSILLAILSSTFLPIYSGYRARGEMERAGIFARTVFRVALVLCVVVAAVGALCSGLLVRLVGPGLAPETASLAARLTAVLFPASGAVTLIALSAAALNSHSVFVLPALHPVVQNAFGIAGVVLLTKRLSVWGVTLGWLVGAVAALVVQIPVLLKVTPAFSRGKLQIRDESVTAMLKMSGPLVLMAAMGQVYGLVDKNLASSLQPGSIAALNYAARVVQLPTGVVVTAVCTLMFPRFAEYWGKRDTVGLSQAVSRSLTIVSALAVPAAFAFASLAVPMVRVVYQRGAFSETAVALTSSAMVFYAGGVLFQGLMLLLTRVAYSMQDSRTPLLATLAGTIVAIGSAYVLVPSMAHTGLALANTLSGLASSLVLGVASIKRIGKGQSRKLTLDHIKIIGASAAMAVVTRVVIVLMPVQGGELRSTLNFLIVAGVGVVVYTLMLLVTGVIEPARVRSVGTRALSAGGVVARKG